MNALQDIDPAAGAATAEDSQSLLTSAPTIVTRAPVDLKPHRKVAHLIGRWRPDSEAALALRRSIQEAGILQPLIITPDNDIIDGVTRWQAAKALQIDCPCIVRPESEALDILLATELHRRHSTKSQRAFRLWPMVAEAYEEHLEKHASALRSGNRQTIGQNLSYGQTRVEAYAVDLGISPSLLKQSHELHTLFASNPEPRRFTSDEAVQNLVAMGLERDAEVSFADYYTAQILDEVKPMALYAALTGIKSVLDIEGRNAQFNRKHPGRANLTEDRQLTLFKAGWETLEKRYAYWTEMDAPSREDAVKSITVAFEHMPEDLLTTIVSRATAIRRSRLNEADKG